MDRRLLEDIKQIMDDYLSNKNKRELSFTQIGFYRWRRMQYTLDVQRSDFGVQGSKGRRMIKYRAK